ncbi:transporter substrate-binding domain-containing protein [Pseudomonas sp. GD03944]|uniref:substrate-binding periplasmic protein n=1 Tax=Pseudomonas sp. GD03944 TaxID=2975409 RepID=UPI00244A2D35|nr:transporter substrate-binding domain-containing protein [Pseudomonas sp. GD03944]MDH1261892.1 transporter substrate-binding domain-containing protein [Pseudomonas sp. GD03944]
MRWIGVVVLCLASLTAGAETLRIGFGTHKPPYIFEGEAKGLEYDIVVAAARSAGYTTEIHYLPLERLHLLLRRGEIDAITPTNEFSGVPAHYSTPHILYENVAVALQARHLKIERIADLEAHSVSAFQRARYLLGSEFQAMSERNPRYREEAHQIARNRLLYSGRIDVVVGDLRVLRYFNREVYTQVDVSQPVTVYRVFPLTAYQVGFRLAEQRDRFNQGLEHIRASGEYEAIERRYAIY